MAFEGYDTHGRITKELTHIKGLRRHSYWLGRVRKEHPTMAPERVDWVWGTSTDGTYRKVRVMVR